MVKFKDRVYDLYMEKKNLNEPPSYIKDIEELLKLEKML
jgi:hypothetical protein